MSDRISIPEYAIALAHVASLRSEDPYRKVGAVALDHANRVIDVRYSMLPNKVDALWSLELVPGAAPDQHARYRTHRDASPSTRDALMDMLLD